MLFKLDFPCLYSFAKRKSCSLAMFLQNLDLLDNFPTPLSTEASEEYIKFTITTIQGTMQGKDKWIYSWVNNNFQSSKVYSLNFQFISPHSIQMDLEIESDKKRSKCLFGCSSEIESILEVCSEGKGVSFLTMIRVAFCVISIVKRLHTISYLIARSVMLAGTMS
jgi:hypothetical protein